MGECNNMIMERQKGSKATRKEVKAPIKQKKRQPVTIVFF
jgi:hypothetical protein